MVNVGSIPIIDAHFFKQSLGRENKYPLFMAKLTFEMSWNYDLEEYQKFLSENKLTHLKSHGEKYFKPGDALKSEKGVIARVMQKFVNCENLSVDITIASNKLSYEEMMGHFQPSVSYTIMPVGE